MRPIRLIQGFLTVGGWTLASRILGFVRDIMIAAYLGTGPQHQAFVIAFSLPNMFRRFFAEGAFNMAFVPMFSKRLEAGEEAETFARDAMSGLLGILLLLTLIAQLAMPALVLAMASGFEDELFDLTVFYGRIAFPYILFISLAALLSGVLNAAGRFAAAAAAPVLLNVVFIGAMTGAAILGADIGDTLIWAVPVAGVAQLALVWHAARKAGFTVVPHLPRMTPELKRLAIIAAPAVLAGGVVQVNLLVGRQVASYYDSAVSWLYNADRLYQLPLGVVAIAIGVVLLPDLSRKLKAEDGDGARHSLSRAAEFSLALTLPAAVALVVIPAPLISVLFQRGAFTAADVGPTALATAIYGIGMPAFVLQKVLQPVFYAREDTKRPFHYAVVAMVVNAALAIGLAPVIGFIAAAIAASVAGWAMAALLWVGSRKMGADVQLDARFYGRLPRIIAASAIMGAALWLAEAVLHEALYTDTLRYGALALLIVIGKGVYLAAAHATGALRLSELKSSMRR
ncbi:integral membrane protein MviN [Actibacterium atlanticum]|uniref:Probable lipid II flippase MurJ n=1 Tax=Actibacterium atlanticum TaxID=1461693 RepID=A0A058ZP02_9RHOB|nr:murein biosynthesis integral membrane protein MurJ [Actibacterium atlanticum]KCV82902.1 integral membrane protein MviN [Actibacterium atlanticum]